MVELMDEARLRWSLRGKPFFGCKRLPRRRSTNGSSFTVWAIMLCRKRSIDWHTTK